MGNVVVRRREVTGEVKGTDLQRGWALKASLRTGYVGRPATEGTASKGGNSGAVQSRRETPNKNTSHPWLLQFSVIH